MSLPRVLSYDVWTHSRRSGDDLATNMTDFDERLMSFRPKFRFFWGCFRASLGLSQSVEGSLRALVGHFEASFEILLRLF